MQCVDQNFFSIKGKLGAEMRRSYQNIVNAVIFMSIALAANATETRQLYKDVAKLNQNSVTSTKTRKLVNNSLNSQRQVAEQSVASELSIRSEQNIYNSRKDQEYGSSVSVDGDLMAVGAELGVYVYQRSGTTWNKLKRIGANPDGDYFVANTLEVSNNLIAYGRTSDPRNEIRGGNGSYLAIERVTNGQTTTDAILTDDGDSYVEDFARHVSIDSNIAVASGGTDDGAEINIYGFEGGTWKFTSSIDINSLFGSKPLGTYRITELSVKGDRIAFESGAFQSSPGTVVILRRISGSWIKEFEVETACDKCMAFKSNILVVGNKVYRLTANGWTFVQIVGPGHGPVSTDGINITYSSGETYRLLGDFFVSTDRLESSGPRISTSGNWVVQSNSGNALISNLSNSKWNVTQKLEADNGTNRGRFGNSVALIGDTAVIGAPYDFRLDGAVYVEQNIGGKWIESARITPNVDEEFAGFGARVSFSGLYVAANSKPDCFLSNLEDQQSVLVFQKSGDTWIQDARLTQQSPTASNPCAFEFGSSISLSGTTLAVATGDGVTIFDRNRTTWTESTRISKSQLGFSEAPGNFESRFAISDIRLSNDSLVVSTKGLDAVQNQVRHSVDIYSRNGQRYIFQQRISVASDATLSLSGDRLAIYGSDFASAYRRSGSRWTKVFDFPGISAFDPIRNIELSGNVAAVLRSSGPLDVYTASPVGYDFRSRLADVLKGRRGSSLAVSGDRLIVGDPANSDFASGAGSVYPFRIDSDFGDAPDTFKTSRLNGGARHFLSGPKLGVLADADLDGMPSPFATGDDTDTTDDEDGVQFANTVIGGRAQLLVSVSQAGGTVDAWLDLNKDLLFSNNERVVAGVRVPVGSSNIPFDVPSNSAIGQTYARVRISTNGIQSPSGTATDGEVEDEIVSLLPLSASVSSVLVAEGNSGETDATFSIRLNAPPLSPVTLQVGTVNGTAVAGTDYRPFTGSLSFGVGETEKFVNVKVIGDVAIEPDEVFELRISSTTPNVLIASGSGTATIVNDDLSATRAEIRLNVTAFNFGSVRVGSTSPSRALVVSSTGTAPLEIKSIKITGDFVGTSGCPRVLNPGLSCRLTGSFRPTVAGQRTGSVVISTNASVSPSVVSLSGTGTSASR